VPEALIAFFDAHSYVDAVRNAVSLGGDSDTLACITGGVAEAFYGGVPDHIQRQVSLRVPQEFLTTIEAFQKKYGENDCRSR
jgi:ADP-ribosylglycohydrolase